MSAFPSESLLEDVNEALWTLRATNDAGYQHLWALKLQISTSHTEQVPARGSRQDAKMNATQGEVGELFRLQGALVKRQLSSFWRSQLSSRSATGKRFSTQHF